MTNSKISTKSSRNVLALALTAGLLFAISGCQKSDTPTETDASTDGVDTGVGTGTPQNIALSFGNAEGNIDFIGTRLNMVSAEIFRTVERLAAVPSLNARLALVNSGGLPSDPFDPNDVICDEGVEVTEYQDNGVAGILDGFDRIAFSYDTAGCTTGTSGSRDIIPGELGGLIILAFTAGTSAPDTPAAKTFIGTAEFINYAYNDGLLFVSGSGGSEQILSGQVDFNITFDVDPTINTTTLSSANGVQLAGGTGDLSSPVTLSFDSVVRTIAVAGGDARTTIAGGAATSELSGTQILFSTMPYPDPAGPDELLGAPGDGPRSGALLFAGANNSSVLVPAEPSGSSLTEAQIDEDGNGYNILPETDDPHIPKSWEWLVLDFLIPGP